MIHGSGEAPACGCDCGAKLAAKGNLPGKRKHSKWGHKADGKTCGADNTIFYKDWREAFIDRPGLRIVLPTAEHAKPAGVAI